MNKPRIWWAGDDKGWVIDTEVALTQSEMLRCVQFTEKVQKDRYRTLMPGTLKDECGRTITALSNFRVTQNMIGTGDKVLYDAYKSDGKKVFA